MYRKGAKACPERVNAIAPSIEIYKERINRNRTCGYVENGQRKGELIQSGKRTAKVYFKPLTKPILIVCSFLPDKRGQ